MRGVSTRTTAMVEPARRRANATLEAAAGLSDHSQNCPSSDADRQWLQTSKRTA